MAVAVVAVVVVLAAALVAADLAVEILTRPNSSSR